MKKKIVEADMEITTLNKQKTLLLESVRNSTIYIASSCICIINTLFLKAWTIPET